MYHIKYQAINLETYLEQLEKELPEISCTALAGFTFKWYSIRSYFGCSMFLFLEFKRVLIRGESSWMIWGAGELRLVWAQLLAGAGGGGQRPGAGEDGGCSGRRGEVGGEEGGEGVAGEAARGLGRGGLEGIAIRLERRR